MSDTSGFYTMIGGEPVRAQVSVTAPGFAMHRDTREAHTYPVEGWWWFDSIEQAAGQLGITQAQADALFPPELTPEPEPEPTD
jgi:hypothetical protein